MFALIPLWLRALALLAIVAAVWGHGAYTGYSHAHGQTVALQAQFDTFKAETAALGKVAEAHVREVEAKQKEITDALTKEFGRRLAAIPRSVQHPDRADGSQIPSFSCSPAGIDGKTADAVPVESIPKSDYDALRHDASVTTLMVVKWQDWYREQQAAFQ